MHTVTDNRSVQITHVNADIPLKENIDTNQIFSSAHALAKFMVKNMSEEAKQTQSSGKAYSEILENDTSAETAATVLRDLGVKFKNVTSFFSLPPAVIEGISHTLSPQDRRSFALTHAVVNGNTQSELLSAKLQEKASQVSSLEKIQNLLGIPDGEKAIIGDKEVTFSQLFKKEIQHEVLTELGRRIIAPLTGSRIRENHKEATTLLRAHIAALKPEHCTKELLLIDRLLKFFAEKQRPSVSLSLVDQRIQDLKYLSEFIRSDPDLKEYMRSNQITLDQLYRP